MKTKADLTPQKLQELANKRMTLGKIAEQYNTTWAQIQYLRRKWNLPKLKNASTSGVTHPRWKGGRTLEKRTGYIKVFAPHRGRISKYTYEHVLLVEKKIGRLLRQNEHVHHIDGNTTNNLLGNLLLVTASEHRILHRQLETLALELVRKGKIVLKNKKYVWKK